jgi:hypothetical protein
MPVLSDSFPLIHYLAHGMHLTSELYGNDRSRFVRRAVQAGRRCRYLQSFTATGNSSHNTSAAVRYYTYYLFGFFYCEVLNHNLKAMRTALRDNSEVR